MMQLFTIPNIFSESFSSKSFCLEVLIIFYKGSMPSELVPDFHAICFLILKPLMENTEKIVGERFRRTVT